MAKKRILILCVDRDNDLYGKAKIGGPVIGRDANIAAATQLALADPEEPDANTMFEAVRIFDQLKGENDAQVATVSGSERLGYVADQEILKQLDRVLFEFNAESCIFVSDGASDEQVIPIIQSRLKVESVRVVVMKQAKELEKTWFVILEKLKEPHYARLIFGIPAIILLLLAAGEFLGFGWRLLPIILGIYLFAKGFGIEDYLLHHVARSRISLERLSFILYLISLALLFVSLAQGYSAYLSISAGTHDALRIIAFATDRLLLLLPWASLFFIAGRVSDLLHEKKRYEVTRYGIYAVSIVILWLILAMTSKWVLGQIYFSELVSLLLISVGIMFLGVKIISAIRMRVALGMKLENKEVLNELGAYIGKTIGVDRRKGIFVVQTALGQKLDMAFENISGIGDRITIRY